jgi:hypothetical protein
MNIKIKITSWEYTFDHNPETGAMELRDTKKVGLVQKAVEYAKAETSALLQKVPLPIIEARKAACDSCESCVKKGEEEWYCKSCGCPQWERSRMQVKWEMPAAHCPLSKWPGVDSNNASS